uniref:Uncharacterized protein n=1 Tax=Anguilla anguilla TaxID=7936 RepID=A0A0E9UBL1_ANGAN
MLEAQSCLRQKQSLHHIIERQCILVVCREFLF